MTHSSIDCSLVFPAASLTRDVTSSPAHVLAEQLTSVSPQGQCLVT